MIRLNIPRMNILLAALPVLLQLASAIAAGDEPASVTAPPSFRSDIMPVFFRAGCNAGVCHGSARGKEGFMLSLFGYDARGDYERVVHDMPG
ncbi:MAG: cell surface protein, partial [Planctomycetaceae bacterium]